MATAADKMFGEREKGEVPRFDTGETKKQLLSKRHKSLEKEQHSWKPHWRELADNFQPRRGRFLFSTQERDDANRGKRKDQHIIDPEVYLASRTLASGMMAGLTSPARPWFRLTTPDPALMEEKSVKVWLHQVERIMRWVFSRSNLYNVLPIIYAELGVFGTAAMAAMEDDKEFVRFYPYTIGSYLASQNEKLQVDTLYINRTMSVRQLVSKFKWESLSETVQSNWRNKAFEQTHPVVQAIEPNSDRDPMREDAQNKPYRSVWFEKGGDDDKLLRESGFDEFPVMIPRWDAISEDTYGSSPGMYALGVAKGLQHQQKNKAHGIEMQVKPALQAPTSLRKKRVNGLPGGITYVDVAQGMQGIKPIHDWRPDLTGLLEDIRDQKDAINRTFFADLFLMLSMADNGDMTAREIAERHEEKLMMLGPVLQRLNDELLDPLIDRTFGILMRRGVLPEPPPELEGVDLKVEYVSMLAQAQQAASLRSMDRLASQVAALAEMDERVMDKFDADQFVDEYAEALGVPPSLVRSDDIVAEIRRQREKLQQMEQASQIDKNLGQAAEAASKASTEGDNALTQLMNSLGGAQQQRQRGNA